MFSHPQHLQQNMKERYELISSTERIEDGTNFLTEKSVSFCVQHPVATSNLSYATLKQGAEGVMCEEDIKICIQHNTNRVPIYIAGENRDSSFKQTPANNNKVWYRATSDESSVFGLAQGAYLEMVNRQITYSVWGKCKALPNTSTEPVEFVSIHAFGVNLESESAVDVPYNTRDDNFFENRCKLMWKSIIQSGIDSQGPQPTDKLVILTPAIGCGAYLANIKTDEEKLEYIKTIFDTLHNVSIEMDDVMQSHKVSIRVVLLNFDKLVIRGFYETIGTTPTCSLQRARLGDGISPLQNLFEPLRCVDVGNETAQKILCGVRLGLVNAWDTFSWIGNGGSQDASIDGWYVAGWGYGQHFINNSYLLNFHK